jgi:DNA-binding HxlR family transcriptional regulator
MPGPVTGQQLSSRFRFSTVADGVAEVLSLVGERWALLVVREV